MSLIQHVFEGREIRTGLSDNGEIYFVAKDVAEALGYRWAGSATISHVPEAWRGVNSVLTPSGCQDMSVITEQGFYFFLGRSDKAGALPMQMWVASEVLPSIRKTGSYTADYEPALLTNSAKIEFVDRYVAATTGNKGFRATAKILQVANEAEFRLFLLESRIMYRLAGEWVAYANQIKAGRMSVRSGVSKEGHVYLESKFTPKGIYWVAGLWAQYKLGAITNE